MLEVVREKPRAWRWVALMIDVDPDEFCARRRKPEATAWFVPDKDWAAGREASEHMTATRH